MVLIKMILNFFTHFFSQISSLSSNSILLIGGDFNVVLNPTIDRSNNAIDRAHPRSAVIVNQYMDKLGLGDCWRIKNKTAHEYSFFSPVHKSFSRIDFFCC